MQFFFLRLRHSAKLPLYMPQILNLGDTALISSGQVINTIGKLIRNVGTRMTNASDTVKKAVAVIVYCKRM